MTPDEFIAVLQADAAESRAWKVRVDAVQADITAMRERRERRDAEDAARQIAIELGDIVELRARWEFTPRLTGPEAQIVDLAAYRAAKEAAE